MVVVASGVEARLGMLESAAYSCLEGRGPARGLDLAWCAVDGVLSGSCGFKALTVYWSDYVSNAFSPRVPG